MESLPDDVLRLILTVANSAYYVCAAWDAHLRALNGTFHYTRAACAMLRLATVRGEWDGYARFLQHERIRTLKRPGSGDAADRRHLPYTLFERNTRGREATLETPSPVTVDPSEAVYEYDPAALPRWALGVKMVRIAPRVTPLTRDDFVDLDFAITGGPAAAGVMVPAVGAMVPAGVGGPAAGFMGLFAGAMPAEVFTPAPDPPLFEFDDVPGTATLLALHGELAVGLEMCRLPTAHGTLDPGTDIEIVWEPEPSEDGPEWSFAGEPDWDAVAGGIVDDMSADPVLTRFAGHLGQRPPVKWAGMVAAFVHGEAAEPQPWRAWQGELEVKSGLADEVDPTVLFEHLRPAALYAQFRAEKPEYDVSPPADGDAGWLVGGTPAAADRVSDDAATGVAMQTAADVATRTGGAAATSVVMQSGGETPTRLGAMAWLHEWRSAETGDLMRDLAAQGYFDDSDSDEDGPRGPQCLGALVGPIRQESAAS